MNFNNMREKDIVRRIREGFGQGEGDTYKGWFQVPDSDSKGRLGRTLGITHETRYYHALSDGEDGTILTLDWAVEMTDARENLYVDRDESVAVARSIGAEHPWNHKDDRPYPLIEDMVGTSMPYGRPCFHPYTVKMREDLNDPRTMELFEISRRLWALRGATLKISIKEEINKEMLKALAWAVEGRMVDGLKECTPSEFSALRDEMRREVDRQSFELVGHLYQAMQSRFSISKRTAEFALKNLVACRKVVTSMESVVTPHCHLARLQVSEPPNRNKAAWR